MISREEQRLIQASWQQATQVSATDAQRLEAMIDAFLYMMRRIASGVEDVQQFWDNADMITKLVAAGSGEALDSGGTVTKEAITKYQVLFLSFKEWLSTAASADVLGTPTTLTETPLQLIMRQPEKVE